MSNVDKINKTVYKDYPFYKGVKPKVSENAKGELLLVPHLFSPGNPRSLLRS